MSVWKITEKMIITEKQKAALLLCHHDYQGRSCAEAARKLGIGPSAVSGRLRRLRKIVPSLFPILTELEILCYRHYTTDGLRIKEIAIYVGRKENSVAKALQRCRRKGLHFNKGMGKMLEYDGLVERYGIDWVDDKIKEKF